MSVTRIFSAAALVLAMSTTAFAQTSDTKSATTAQPDPAAATVRGDMKLLRHKHVGEDVHDTVASGGDKTPGVYVEEIVKFPPTVGRGVAEAQSALDANSIESINHNGNITDPNANGVQSRANINTSRSNKKSSSLAGPEDGGIDYFDDQDRLSRASGEVKTTDVTATSDHVGSRNGIAVMKRTQSTSEQQGCVTTAGAVDANCDGVADAEAATADHYGRISERLRHKDRK